MANHVKRVVIIFVTFFIYACAPVKHKVNYIDEIYVDSVYKKDISCLRNVNVGFGDNVPTGERPVKDINGLYVDARIVDIRAIIESALKLASARYRSSCKYKAPKYIKFNAVSIVSEASKESGTTYLSSEISASLNINCEKSSEINRVRVKGSGPQIRGGGIFDDGNQNLIAFRKSITHSLLDLLTSAGEMCR